MAKGKVVSFQITTEIDLALTNYENEHHISRSKAIRHFLKLGIGKHESGTNAPVTKADLIAAVETLGAKIDSQPIQVQQALPEPETIETEKKAAQEAERLRIANMGYFERRRYLRGEMV